MTNLKPREEVPELILETTKGLQWNLRDQFPENFIMLVFYRGVHCPLCKKYLEELNEMIENYKDRGVDVICISANSKELALQTVEEWEIENLNIGFSFSPEQAREWGLYISESIKEGEPEVFLEPALFLVNKDHTLYSASIQSMPFARPDLNELLRSITFILKDDYPARGEK